MRTPQRLICLVFLLFALAAGCGDDEEEPATSTISPQPTSGQTSAVATTTTIPGGVIQGAVDGASCSPQGARGMTQAGAQLLCQSVGGELRWRPS
jgi:hypothetical protein